MSLFRSRTVNSDQKKLENLKDAISNRASGNFVMEAEGRDDRKGSGKGIKRDKSIFRAMMHKVNQIQQQDKRKQVLVKCFNGRPSQEFQQDAQELDNIPYFKWEYVIMFQNPDWNEQDMKQINEEEAQEIFENCFEGQTGQYLAEVQFNKQTEKAAFMECFKGLPDVEEAKSDKYTELEEMVKKFNHGGNFYPKGSKWEMDTRKPKDFLSLIRNVIHTKITLHLGLKARLLSSKSGQFFYLTIMPTDDLIYHQAEQKQLQLKLEIGAVDLESLLPCDENLRPYRTLAQPQWLNDYDNQLDSYFKEFLTDYVNEEAPREKFKGFKVTEEHWQSYKEFVDYCKQWFEILQPQHQPLSIRGLLYKKVIKAAFESVNLSHPNAKLKNLWNYFNTQVKIAPHCDFMGLADIDLFNSQYKTYNTDESFKRSLIKPTQRIKLLFEYINSQINLEKLHEEGVIAAHFPTHNILELEGVNSLKEISGLEGYLEESQYSFIIQSLQSEDGQKSVKATWTKELYNSNFSLHKIKVYFGEKIALYFFFLHSYTKWLIIPALLGVIVFTARLMQFEPEYQDDISAIYCIGIVIWGTIFMEYWKQQQTIKAIQWGQMKFEEQEPIRPGFKGYFRRSPVNDSMNSLHYPNHKRRRWQFLSFLITAVILSVILIFIISVLEVQIIAQRSKVLEFFGFDCSNIVTSSVHAVQIMIINHYYEKAAFWLTGLENYKTRSKFEGSLIFKLVSFEFINAYNVMIYLAFVKVFTHGCYEIDEHGEVEGDNECMFELQIELGCVYGLIFLNNVYLTIKNRLNTDDDHYRIKKAHCTSLKLLRNLIDQQAEKNDYEFSHVDGTFGDYLELVVQYGFVTLFAVAFPLAPLLALITNILEDSVDRDKILNQTRRPIPYGAKSIGSWYKILNVVTTLSMITNAGILCFTIGAFVDWPVFNGNPFVPFILLLSAMFFLRQLIKDVLPSLPEKYKMILDRHDWLVNKKLKGELKKEKIYEPTSQGINFNIEGIKR